MFTQHSSESEAKQFHLEAVESVQGTSWMGVMWHIKDGRMVLERRTTWNFPLDDLEEVIRLLREMCEREMKENSPPVPMPLRVASFAKGSGDGEGGVSHSDLSEKPEPPPNRSVRDGEPVAKPIEGRTYEPPDWPSV